MHIAQMANFIHGFTCIQSPFSQTRTKPEPDLKPGFCGLPNPKPGFSKKASGLESLLYSARHSGALNPSTMWAVIFSPLQNTNYDVNHVNHDYSCCTISLLHKSRMHKSSTFRREKIEKNSGAQTPPSLERGYPFPRRHSCRHLRRFHSSTGPTIFNKFTPMNSCDVLLYSVARPMFILIYAYFAVHTNTGITGITGITSEYRKIQSFCRQT